ncbi:MAG: hypothetical protein E2590_15675 [Chryseobacterium sp.]|nr:hypothetical protein [Chryseobacterium sp.]
MKNLLQVLLILPLFISCSSNDNDEITPEDITPILPVKITETTKSGNTYYLTMKYDGDKIIESNDEDGSKTVYTYNGNNIVKSVEYDKNSNIVYTQEFAYNNDRLSSEKITDTHMGTLSYTINYNYVNDNTVKYKLLESSTYNSSTGTFSNFKYTDYETTLVNGNVSKIKRTLSSGMVINRTYIYDNKNNPFSNIKGFVKINLLTSYDGDYGVNNLTKLTSSSTDSYFNYTNTTSYEYNSNNYPVKQLTNYTDNSNGSSTTVYQYNK